MVTRPHPKTAVVIPVFNRREITLRCLEKLCSGTALDICVIVVDSGSTDGTPQAIREKYSQVILLQADPSAWWTAATNAGIRWALEAGCQYLLTYNDDNQASLEVLHKLMTVAEKNPASIVAATICELHSPDTVIFAGRRRSRFTDRFIYMNHYQSYARMDKGLREVDLLHGRCTLFPSSVFLAAGFFDEKNFPHLFADDDLVLRAKRMGYRLLVDLDTVVINDLTATGLNPYDHRLGIGEIAGLFTSRKSAFQITTRTRFLWRHRRTAVSFLVTWCMDYLRLLGIIMLRWLVSDTMYRRIERCYLRLTTP